MNLSALVEFSGDRVVVGGSLGRQRLDDNLASQSSGKRSRAFSRDAN